MKVKWLKGCFSLLNLKNKKESKKNVIFCIFSFLGIMGPITIFSFRPRLICGNGDLQSIMKSFYYSNENISNILIDIAKMWFHRYK